MYAINWKGVLLSWVHKVADSIYAKDDFCRYEYPDVEEFFTAYKQQFVKEINQDLEPFLTVNYPDLDVDFNAGRLSIIDYVYVYSLLLHYACAETKEPNFLEIVVGLPEKYQNSINKFFELIKVQHVINRETIRDTITSVVSKQPELKLYESFDRPLPPTPTKIIRAKNIELDEQCSNYGKLIEDMKAEKERNENEFKKKLNLLKSEVADLEEKLSEKEKLIEVPDCTLQTKQVRMEFQQKVIEKEGVIRKLEEQIKELQAEIFALNSALKQALDKNLKLVTEMNSIEEEYNEEIQFLNQELHAIKEEKNSIEMYCNELRQSMHVKRFNSADIEYSFKEPNNNLYNQSSPKKPDTSSPVGTPPSFAACSFSDGYRRLSTIANDSIDVGPDLLNVGQHHVKSYAISPTDNLALLLDDSTRQLKRVNPKLFRQHGHSFETPPRNRFDENAPDSDPIHIHKRSYNRARSVENRMPLSQELNNVRVAGKLETSVGHQASLDIDVVAHSAKLVDELIEAKREVATLKEELGKLLGENEELRMSKDVEVLPKKERKKFRCNIL